MKSVLISIQPKWCELIASGKKTVEVRKTRPKIETPFKCYIYCTNTKPYLVWGDVFRGNWETEFTHLSGYNRKDAEKIWDVFNGKVIGEFVCDWIEPYWFALSDDEDIESCEDVQLACLSAREIKDYGGERDLYFWHISDLVIYDEPRRLSEFASFCYKANCCGCEHSHVVENLGSPFVGSGRYNIKCVCDHLKPLKRPPQSWGYVEGGAE